MSQRVKLSVFLLIMGFFLAFIPREPAGRFSVNPGELRRWVNQDTLALTVDEVARLINNETPGITLIDVRNEADFAVCSLPGAVHIPLNGISLPDHKDLLGRREWKNIFYSNGDEASAAALVIAAGLGYKNCYRMKGGLNGWYAVVMNATFSGDRITAKENALFANRSGAGRLFTEYNSLPDSLKSRLFESRLAEKAKLDGGCE